jgi:hypothetical protein
MINSRRIIWAEYVAQMERKGMHIIVDGKVRRKQTTRKTLM